jgi:hypothetical protein
MHLGEILRGLCLAALLWAMQWTVAPAADRPGAADEAAFAALLQGKWATSEYRGLKYAIFGGKEMDRARV